MDRHPVRQDHLPQPGRLRSAGELELIAAARPALGITFPLLLWLGVQLATVALVNSRFPLWAKYPRTSESLTPAALLIVQITAAALLFPILLRDWRSAAVVIASAWPFTLVAAAISSTPTASAVFAGGYVSAWLLSLTAWRPLLRSERAVAIAQAAAICITGSGPITRYLMTDFATGSAVERSPTETGFAPVFAALSLLDPVSRSGLLWLLPSLLLFAAGLTALAQRRRSPEAD